MIGAFVATLAGYQVKTVEQKLCAIRSFLRFAADAGLAGGLPGGGPGGEADQAGKDPVGVGPGQVAKILQAIDRGNPCGNGITR